MRCGGRVGIGLCIFGVLAAGGCTSESTRVAIETQRRADEVQQAVFERQHEALCLLLYRDLVRRPTSSPTDLPAEQRQALAKTDPAAYWEAFWPWRKDWDARADAAAKVVTDSVSAEQARAKEIRQEAKEIETRATEAMQEGHPLM